MELSSNARITYEKRYLVKDERGKPLETPEDLLRRVAVNIASVESNYDKSASEIEEIENSFFKMMATGQFMPNSPTLMNAGRELQQLSACFVLPLEDSMEGIFTALKNMALVQKTGGGTGFSFDRLRPANDPVRSTNGVASGPISFLRIFDAATEAVKQGGTRRGANMGSLAYNHPNILEFIRCKEIEDEVNNFNLSVTVSDEFMNKATGIDPDPLYSLINPRTGKPYCDPQTGHEVKLDAGAVFDLVVQNAWSKGDPGIIFIDQMNRFNPTPDIGKYETTNPCLPADVLVLTEEGPRRVGELAGKKSTLVVNGKFFETGEEGFFSNGSKPLYQLSTMEGFSMRATGDHPVLKISPNGKTGFKEEWVCTKELRKGDRIKLHDHREGGEWNGLYGFGEGYILGLFTAYKFVDKSIPANIPGENLVINNFFNIITALEETKTEQTGNDGSNPSGDIHQLRREMKEINKIAQSLDMELPPQKITSGLETRTSSSFTRGFLIALFDFGSAVVESEDKEPFIKLVHADRNNLAAVQRMLARLGIIAVIKKESGGKGNAATLSSNRTCTDRGNQHLYELIVPGENLHVYFNKLGYYITSKQNKLELHLSKNKKKLRPEDFSATVETVSVNGEEKVYDVRVPGINAFDANGIVVHNCGEQPLLPYEACCLGSINLGMFANSEGKINWSGLAEVTKTAVRFLDNVIDAGNYVIPEISKMHKEGNRKIGLGIMGWHDMLIRLDTCYDSEEAIDIAGKVMDFINSEARKESVSLAEERGVFPNFEGSIYDTGKSEDRVRNATRTTIAPTGTISILAGCSSGIEPYFSIAYIRKNILGGVDLPEVNPLFLDIARKEGFYSEELIHDIAARGKIPQDSAVPDRYKKLFKTAMDFDYSWHVRHQAAFQKHTDNAVSKTVNLKKDATVEDVMNAYILAWESGCKGITIYRDSSRSKQVLNVGDGKKEETLKPIKRPKTLSGQTTSIGTALGNLFVTVNSANGKPFELFAQIGKAGSDVVAFTEAIARLISLALRCGVGVEEIVTQLEGIGGARSVGYGPNRIMSVPDAIGQALRKLAQVKQDSENASNGNNLELCPDCGTCALVRAEGCLKCEACGFSEC